MKNVVSHTPGNPGDRSRPPFLYAHKQAKKDGIKVAKRTIRKRRRHGTEISGHTIKRPKPLDVSLAEHRHQRALKRERRAKRRVGA